MKKKKGHNKKIFSILGIFGFLYVGVFGSAPFISKYWFPKEVRTYLISPKYEQGQCLRSKRWGVNPKKVVGYKETKKQSFYLLRDLDRHEHLQYLSQYEVNRHGIKSSCRI